MTSLVKRSIFGIVFLAVMLAGILVNEWLFMAIFTAIGAIMLGEYYKMVLGEKFKVQQVMGLIMGICVTIAAYLVFSGRLTWAYLPPIGFTWLLIINLSLVCSHEREHISDSTPLYAGLLYITIPVILWGAVAFPQASFDGSLLLSFFIIIWSSDVGAYCIGMLFGQKGGKKLCPSISPKKSWAGFWGGLAAAVIAGVLLKYFGLANTDYLHIILLSLIIAVTGVFGDLFESLWKRNAGVKDSGNIIPGHGGLMDRFDSALFAIPAAYVYLMLISL